MTIFSNDKDEKVRLSKSTQTGVCGRCHERYISAPIIDGRAQCPNCDKP